MTDTTLDRAVPLSQAAVSAAPAQVQVQAHVQTTLNYVPVQNAALKNAAIIPMSLRSVHFVMPGGVDDPAKPSGGNAYDRRISLDLPGFGWQVHKHAVAGELAPARRGRPRRTGADAARAAGRHGRPARRPGGLRGPRDHRPGGRTPAPRRAGAPPAGRRDGPRPGRRGRAGRPGADHPAGGALGDRDQRLGRPPPRLPPRTRPGPRAHGGPRRRHRPPRLRHRRRLPPALRGRRHPAQGPAPAGGGAGRGDRPAVELRLRRRARPGPRVRRRPARPDRQARPRRTGCTWPARRRAPSSTPATPPPT